MSRLVGLGGWIDDRINPIVVKELRQAVNSRFIIGVLFLMLTVLVIVQMLFVMNSTTIGTAGSEDGASLFLIFQGVLLAVCMLAVPIYVGARLTAERATATSDLLYVTTIRPTSIVWGKLVAGMTVTLLVFSTCAPFMVVTYLLRGIDPPTVLFVLGLDFMIVLSASMLAIFVGALPVGWPVKTLLGIVLLAASVAAYMGVTSFVMFEVTVTGMGSAFDDPEFWWGMAAVVSIWLAALGVIFFLTTAMITPAAANRGLPIRLYVSLVWLGTFALAAFVARYYGEVEVLMVWAGVLSFAILLPGIVLSTSERDVYGARLRRGIPKTRLFRLPAFLLYSGAAGGLLWGSILFTSSLVLTTTLGMWVGESSAWAGFSSGSGWRERHGAFLWKLATCGLFVWGYAMLGVTLRRLLLKTPKSQLTTAGLVLATMALAAVVPVFIAFAMNPDRWDLNEEIWLILNPVGAMVYSVNGGSRMQEFHWLLMGIGTVLAAVGTLVNVTWFWQQAAAFKPLDTPATPSNEATATEQPDG
ncbi:MAG: hypothetical protein AAF328_06685 [Planctomycetota bacterium]